MPLSRERERQILMPETKVSGVYNNSSDYILFVNLEKPDANQYLAPNENKEIGYAVPWCSSHDQFLKKGIIIINRFKKTVLGYIWQDHEPTGAKDDRVRLGFTGWDTPSKENKIPGESNVGGQINLLIDAEGKISAEEA